MSLSLSSQGPSHIRRSPSQHIISLTCFMVGAAGTLEMLSPFCLVGALAAHGSLTWSICGNDDESANHIIVKRIPSQTNAFALQRGWTVRPLLATGMYTGNCLDRNLYRDYMLILLLISFLFKNMLVIVYRVSK